jgi:glycosidase
MFNVVRFWLERGVDGFRIDVAHFIMKDPSLRDNPVLEEKQKAFHKSMGEYDTQNHIYDKGHPDSHRIYKELRKLLDEYSTERPRVSIGEIHIFDWKKWAAFYGQNLDEIHLPFNFQLLNVPWKAEAVRSIVDELEKILPPGAWPNYVLGNHDEPRLASRLDPQAARVAAMLLLTLRGTPTLYYGDEIGLTDGYVPNEQRQDPFGFRVAGMGRDPCRTPMQWNSVIHAGFSPPTTPRLWLPVGENYRQVNVQSQKKEPHSMLSLYRQLIAYRKGSKPLRWGKYVPVDNVPSDCFAYIRKTIDDELVLMILNFSVENKAIKLTGFNKGELKISTFLDRSGEINLSGWILRGNEGVIIELC